MGKTDTKIVDDFKGNPVLPAFALLAVKGIFWVLPAEIDEAEVLEPGNELLLSMVAAGVIIATMMGIIAVFFAISIATPLAKGSTSTQMVSKGDLTAQIDLAQNHEVGMMAADKSAKSPCQYPKNMREINISGQ